MKRREEETHNCTRAVPAVTLFSTSSSEIMGSGEAAGAADGRAIVAVTAARTRKSEAFILVVEFSNRKQ